jgi:hypothetical protein
MKWDNDMDFQYNTVSWQGRDSSVSIVTRYGLDGPRIESRWGRDFPHPSRRALGHTQPPIQGVLGLFPRGEVAGAWRWPHTPSSAEAKERVQLYLYSPSGPLWPVIGWTLSLPLQFLEVITWITRTVTSKRTDCVWWPYTQYSQLYLWLYPLIVWTCNKLHNSM